MDQLRMAVRNMVFDEFEETEPGKWNRKHMPNQFFVLPTELIHRADQIQILTWIENQK